MYRKQGRGFSSGNVSLEPATVTSDYSLLYSTVYSTVCSTEYIVKCKVNCAGLWVFSPIFPYEEKRGSSAGCVIHSLATHFRTVPAEQVL